MDEQSNIQLIDFRTPKAKYCLARLIRLNVKKIFMDYDQFVENARISKDTLDRILAGDHLVNYCPTLKTRNKVFKALGITYDEFVYYYNNVDYEKELKEEEEERNHYNSNDPGILKKFFYLTFGIINIVAAFYIVKLILTLPK